VTFPFVLGRGGIVSGLEAIVTFTFPFVLGRGGIVSGLEAIVTLPLPFVLGRGGMVSGLAAMITLPLPFVLGRGGIVSGLAANITLPLPFVLGRGGMVSGLAIATVVTAAMAAIKTAPRIVIDLSFMALRSSVEKELRIQRVTRKWDIRYPKSNIARKFFAESSTLLILRGFGALFRLLFAPKIKDSPSVCLLPRCVSARQSRKISAKGPDINTPSTT